MSLIFITDTTVIPISNIKGIEINESENSYTYSRDYRRDYEVAVYYTDGQEQSCEHIFDDTFEDICEAQTFVRDKLGNMIIDTE